MRDRSFLPLRALILVVVPFACDGCAPIDADVAESQAGVTGDVYSPSADTYVRSGSYADRNFGSATTVQADGSDSGTIKRGFIRFDIPSVGSVQKALLRLYVKDGSASSAEVWTLSSSFSESSTTWNNAPKIDGIKVATIGATASSTSIDVDVTAGVEAGKPLLLAFLPRSSDGFDFASRESSNKPQLIVQTGATVGVDGGTAPDAATPPPPVTTVSGTYYDDTYGSLGSGLPVTTLSGDYGFSRYTYDKAADGAASAIDARAALFTVANSKNADPTLAYDCTQGSLPTNPYPIAIYDADQLYFVGGLVRGQVPQAADWEPTYCNSAAIAFRNAPSGIIDGIRIDSAWDAIRFSAGSVGTTVTNTWVSNVHDDGVENDFLLAAQFVDSLFDGLMSGISVRPASSNTIPDSSSTIMTISGSLFRLQEFLYKGEMHVTGFIKNADISPSMHIRNTVVAYDYNGGTTSIDNWTRAWAKTTVSDNNLFLFMSDLPIPSTFPMPPAGFTVKKGADARAAWAAAKANWINCHPKVARLSTDPVSDPSKCQANTWGGYTD